MSESVLQYRKFASELATFQLPPFWTPALTASHSSQGVLSTEILRNAGSQSHVHRRGQRESLLGGALIREGKPL